MIERPEPGFDPKIERLRADNERLRAALKEIFEYEELTHGATWAQARARRALKQIDEQKMAQAPSKKVRPRRRGNGLRRGDTVTLTRRGRRTELRIISVRAPQP